MSTTIRAQRPGQDPTEIKSQMLTLRTQSRTEKDNKTNSVLLQMTSSVLRVVLLLLQCLELLLLELLHLRYKLLVLDLSEVLPPLLRVLLVQHKRVPDLYQLDGNSVSRPKADLTLLITIHEPPLGSIHDDNSSSEL